MNKYCKVNNCRYPEAHTTVYHQCGTCKSFGHGMIECGNPNKIKYLKEFNHDVLPIEKHCLFGGCINPPTHITESHTCEQCYERSHSKSTCPTNIKETNIMCPNCRKINKSTLRSFGSENKCVVCFEDAQIFLPDCGHNCLCLKCSKTLDKNNNLDELYDENYLIENHYNVPLIKSQLENIPCYVVVYQGMGCCTLVRRLNETSNIEGLFVHSDDGYNPNKVRINQEFINGYCKIDTEIMIVHDR
jgi:hypothetical protein